MLEYVFGFAEHQEKGIYESGYKVPKTRKVDNSVLSKEIAAFVGKIKSNSRECYVPLFIPSILQQSIFLSKQTLSKLPTELQNLERSAVMKAVNTQKNGPKIRDSPRHKRSYMDNCRFPTTR